MWSVGEQADRGRRAARPTGAEETVGSVPASLGAGTARSARGAEGRGEFPVLAKWSPARSCASAFSPGPAVPDTCRVRSGSPPPSKSRLFSQFFSAASASFICGALSSRCGVPREKRTRELRRRPGMLQPLSAPRPAPGPGRKAPPPGGPAQRRRRRWQSCWHGCDPSFVSCPIPEPGQAGEGAGVGKERKPLYGSWPHLLPPPPTACRHQRWEPQARQLPGLMGSWHSKLQGCGPGAGVCLLVGWTGVQGTRLPAAGRLP